MAVIGGWFGLLMPWSEPPTSGGPPAEVERSQPHGPARYQPPTEAPVLDPFRPPPEPWLPGNRGIEYATTPGAPVAAIGPGAVAFAGPVAGRLVVTVDHLDGLRSSYVGLVELDVAKGERVMADQVIGRACGPFHLGVRRGDTYLDPASLWGHLVGTGRVILVPDDAESPGTSWAPTRSPPS